MPPPTIAGVLTFADEVYELVRSVPEGRVTTYGTLARMLGRPRSARMVGWAMSRCPEDVPAHRVVNHSGTLSGGWAFGHPSVQRALLEAEGVVFVAEERCDLRRHGWPDGEDGPAARQPNREITRDRRRRR
jgi:methylated-DNA-protein-cysteine methyltransferase-like protein